MSYGLVAYSDKFQLRDISIRIVKAQNGFIFELDGERKTRLKKGWNYENFSAKFVYEKLEDGLVEVNKFFNIIEKELKKK